IGDCVAPRVDAPIRTPGRVLPLGLCGQRSVTPFAIGAGLMPCDAVDGVIVAIVVVLVAQGAEDRSLQVPLLLGEIPPRPVTVAKRPLAFSLGGALAVGTQRDLGLIEAEIGDLDLMG